MSMLLKKGLHLVEDLIGWHVASILSLTECKQDSDWLLASPHWAIWKKKKEITGFAVSRRPRLDDENR